MFTRKLDPDELIPILNKPAAAPQPSAANEARLGMERNLEENKNKRRLRNNVEPVHKCDLEVPFKVFEHFIISKKSIRELNCSVHIVFLEDFKKLPPFGISLLSYLDLWKDQMEADIQEFKQDADHKQQADSKIKIKQKNDNELNFVKIIPYQHSVSDIPQPEYDRIVPQKNETLSITFQQNIIEENDASNNEKQKIVNALKIYFQFSKQPPTNWFFVHYPPFVNDFSIVIKIEKEKFESGALKIFTTRGYLKWQGQKGNILHVEENPINPVQSVPNAIVEERMIDGVRECHICMEETGHFVLLHPCGHYNTHEKCILQKEKKDYLDELVGNYNCTMCNNNKPVTKFIHLRFAGKICNFCPKEENCTKFDSYYYPCGCSLGCYEGLLKKLAQKELKLHCKKCNKIMENFYKIYTS